MRFTWKPLNKIIACTGHKRRKKSHDIHVAMSSTLLSRAISIGLQGRHQATLDRLLHCWSRLASPVVHKKISGHPKPSKNPGLLKGHGRSYTYTSAPEMQLEISLATQCIQPMSGPFAIAMPQRWNIGMIGCKASKAC